MSIDTIDLSQESKDYLVAFAGALDANGIAPEHRDAFVGDVANLLSQGVELDAFESPEDFAEKLAGFLAGQAGGCGCGGGGCCGGGQQQEAAAEEDSCCGGHGKAEDEGCCGGHGEAEAGCGCGGGAKQESAGCGCGGH